jgi:hypothetical protein
MQIPQLFDYRSFNEIPSEKGLYSFFFSFEYVMRLLEHYAEPEIDIIKTFEKCKRAHTLSNPENVNINLYGKAVEFSSFLRISSSHLIELGFVDNPMPTSEFKHIASILSKCTLLTSPIYIGIAETQTFSERFNQHQIGYEKLKKKIASGIIDDSLSPFDGKGNFYDRLVRRNIEFRDLIFACVPLKDEELKQVKMVEKILQAIINPPLSTFH